MKKYSINYNRVFPDHRVPYDYAFNKELMKSPATFYRITSQAFNVFATRYFHILLTIGSTVAVMLAGMKYFQGSHEEIELNKKDFPGYKYILLTKKGGYGAYDNILQRFQNEKGGIRDQEWEL